MEQKAKDEAAAVVDQIQGIESEVKAFHSMTQRMVLTQSEMVCYFGFILFFPVYISPLYLYVKYAGGSST